MSDDEILERIKKVITNQLGIEPDEIKLESTFFEDLDADSLDIVELILTFEEAFKIDISDEAAAETDTRDDAEGANLEEAAATLTETSPIFMHEFKHKGLSSESAQCILVQYLLQYASISPSSFTS